MINSALHTILAWLIGCFVFLAKPCHGTTYFVASFPSEKKIVYMKEGPPMRDLIIGGHESLGAIAIDTTNARLYVADNAIQTIFWYQLVALPDGRLTTDGRKNIALVTVEAYALDCDGQGNLYVGGRAIRAPTPSMPAPPVSIMKFTWYQLLTGDTSILNIAGIWNVQNSGDPAKLWMPSSMATDGSRIFWGNSEQGGTHGTLVEGPIDKPAVDPVSSLKVHVDQGEELGSVALTPEYLFYSTENGIFGTPRYKKEQGCGKPADTTKKKLNAVELSLKNGGETGPCRRISSDISATKGMVWDGDGTVYALDPKSGIYSFPSGNIEEHKVTEIMKIEGLEDMDVLPVSFSWMLTRPSVLCLVILAAAQSLLQR
eukprot:gnl/MRDRNA2_/MRDRNA2_90088_c0_seq1.p1 gnl/MRDRNA2_/MRDRNA2_90088_c0~~gnl/MRDRNA2_/MRDRNA2_90088_c0_seq1.p1  ORF type:complete len:372 (+),score=68.57 gnl/MRDRNA2_/MRDRNA2_90088_c0_seq1:205-1320(+)